jgi:hypothetical protein
MSDEETAAQRAAVGAPDHVKDVVVPHDFSDFMRPRAVEYDDADKWYTAEDGTKIDLNKSIFSDD